MSSPYPGHSQLAALPDIVLEFIRDRYLAGVADAEAQYENAMGDEDSLTGALGALISTSRPRLFQVGAGVEIEVHIDYRKLRGRGNDAPEKRLGPDGIFQIKVSGAGISTFQKGLPFQAKKNWRGKDSRLANQARNMKRTLGGGIVIDYTSRGYSACDISDVMAANGSRKFVADRGNVHKLGQTLAHDFLECRIGMEGLYYENQGEAFSTKAPDKDIDVIDTNVSVRPR